MVVFTSTATVRNDLSSIVPTFPNQQRSTSALLLLSLHPLSKRLGLPDRIFQNSEPVWMLFTELQHVRSQTNADWYFATEWGGTARFGLFSHHFLSLGRHPVANNQARPLHVPLVCSSAKDQVLTSLRTRDPQTHSV